MKNILAKSDSHVRVLACHQGRGPRHACPNRDWKACSRLSLDHVAAVYSYLKGGKTVQGKRDEVSDKNENKRTINKILCIVLRHSYNG